VLHALAGASSSHAVVSSDAMRGERLLFFFLLAPLDFEGKV
jgi:hypothetical protein